VIVHIDEGFDFLGMHIQRHKKLGAAKRYVYTYPSRAALAGVKAKVRSATRGTTNQSLSELVNRLNPVLRGWTNYHRHGVSSKTFAYLSAFTWRRVWIWLRHKHPKVTVKELRRRYLPGWWPTQDETRLFKPDTVAIVRYRYRGTAIPSPWVTKESVA
jgi:RNA-directed DNA polymerase